MLWLADGVLCTTSDGGSTKTHYGNNIHRYVSVSGQRLKKVKVVGYGKDQWEPVMAYFGLTVKTGVLIEWHG